MPRKTPEHTRFKPGVSGNPGGRPKNRLTIEKLRDIIDRLSFMTRAELQVVIQNPETKMIELELASVIAQAAKNGDYSRISFILDRAIGRVVDVRENHNVEHDKDLAGEPRPKLYQFVKNGA